MILLKREVLEPNFIKKLSHRLQMKILQDETLPYEFKALEVLLELMVCVL